MRILCINFLGFRLICKNIFKFYFDEILLMINFFYLLIYLDVNYLERLNSF